MEAEFPNPHPHRRYPVANTPDLQRFFRAEHISTPLLGSTSVAIDEAGESAAARLRAGRFDQAPVIAENRFVGWVLRSDLDSARTVLDALHRLEHCTILSTNAPLVDLLPVLAREQMVLLAGPRGLQAFVTPSDLDRQAARGHLYLLVINVELLLADIVTARVQPEIIENLITGGPRKRWQAAREADTEVRPVEYLTLGPSSGYSSTTSCLSCSTARDAGTDRRPRRSTNCTTCAMLSLTR